MKNISLSFFLFFLASNLFAHGWDGDYAVSKIPASLLTHADVVKRIEIQSFEITSDNHAKYYLKVAYTILNENGDRWGYFSEGYDKLRSIESFDGALYDANGIKLKSLKKGDIKDESGSDESNLTDDNRVKWHSFFYKVYPYTVEYEVEVRYKGTMFMPKWMPQEKSSMSVMDSKLSITSPAINPVRYKMFNYNGQPTITDDKSNKIYTWTVNNLVAVEPEYASPSWHELTTTVYLASEKFALENYSGSNSTWNDFGKFVYDLKKDRDELPPDVKQKVHQLIDGLTDQKEKIKVLYEYMQQNTRYVSVQLGIGGWQPYDAKYVSAKKYGDCKALANFMYSLLKEAGIRSVYTVTYRGDENNYLIKDLPSTQFNHVILFVPQGKDTTWLECTSQTYAPGYVGGDNCNRYAVAIDENGGTLVQTPKYGVNENVEIRNIKATVKEEGNLEAIVKTYYKAVQQDQLHYLITGLSKDKLMEFLKEDLELPTYDIRSFDYKQDNGKIPGINETLDLVVNNYATVTGKRLFITPNIMTRTHRKLPDSPDRKYELVLDFEFRDIDTVEINLPSGYSPESIPSEVILQSKFGKYSATIQIEGNKIFYYRRYEHYSGRFPAKDYAELQKFYNDIYRADRAKLVLVKNE